MSMLDAVPPEKMAKARELNTVEGLGMRMLIVDDEFSTSAPVWTAELANGRWMGIECLLFGQMQLWLGDRGGKAEIWHYDSIHDLAPLVVSPSPETVVFQSDLDETLGLGPEDIPWGMLVAWNPDVEFLYECGPPGHWSKHQRHADGLIETRPKGDDHHGEEQDQEGQGPEDEDGHRSGD